jgi:hypothetical protein
VHYDPAALSYEGEVALNDATLRASNPAVGEIRVAAVSAEGVDVARLAAFRFSVRNPAAVNSVRFELDEVHALSRMDLKSVVSVSAPRTL